MSRVRFIALTTALLLLPSCSSIKKSAMRSMSSVFSGAADEFSLEGYPELVRGAVPFSLRVMETVLKEDPKNPQLLLGLSKGFSQFACGYGRHNRGAPDYHVMNLIFRRARPLLSRLDKLFPGAKTK